MAKTISVKCETAMSLPWESLVDFQGSLKILSKSNHEKLKESITNLGFSFPIFVWKFRSQYHVIDGHQRLAVLKALQEEGFEVPDEIPVVEIQARTQKEARKKLLAAVSQYGEVTVAGLQDFIDSIDMNIEEVIDQVKIPNVNIDAMLSTEKVDLSEDLPRIYQLVMDFENEQDLQAAFEKFEEEYQCKILIL